jgi:tRNA pseudouridine55 synthase
MSAAEPTPARGLLVDKTAGVTSHDVVAQIRREHAGKVGHAGTLDPFATGLLVVLLGRATRLQRYLLALPKTYRATARLGWRSSTGDPDGELTQTSRVPERLELPTGQIEQRVPMTSAVKVGGERLYRKAHRGESVETPIRRVTVHRAELIESDGDRATFEIECSSGTYVRTLIETLEDAYCESLRRLSIDDLHVPEQSPQEIAAEELVSFLPERLLDDEEVAAVSHGRPVLEPFDVPPEHVRLTYDGRLVAVARVDGENLRPEVVLA